MISGVILAAGQSARLGRPKQLLDLGGRPVLTHVLRNAMASDLDEVVLVLGHEASKIENAVGEWGQRTVINPDYAAGQSTSLRLGLTSIDPNASAVLFLLGDQPQVSPAVIDAVIAAYRASPAPIIVPTYGGAWGNPVLFDRRLFPDLAEVQGDQGARGVLHARRDLIATCPVADGPPPRDIDTEEDYQAVRREFARAATSSG